MEAVSILSSRVPAVLCRALGTKPGGSGAELRGSGLPTPTPVHVSGYWLLHTVVLSELCSCGRLERYHSRLILPGVQVGNLGPRGQAQPPILPLSLAPGQAEHPDPNGPFSLPAPRCQLINNNILETVAQINF